MGYHYIPQYYLKGFEDPNKPGFIWAFRNSNPPFQISIRKIAQEDKFYSQEMEEYLSNIVEGPANKVIAKIQDQKKLDEEEKIILAQYIIVMWKRVPEGKLLIQEKFPIISNPIFGQVQNDLNGKKKNNSESTEIVDIQLRKLQDIRDNYTNELIEDIWLSNIPGDKTPKSVILLSKMTWQFMLAGKDHYFITSDNPFYFFRSMGIANHNSEVNFPISKNVALWATWRKDILEGYFSVRPQLVKEVNRRVASIHTDFLFSPYRANWINKLSKQPNNYLP